MKKPSRSPPPRPGLTPVDPRSHRNPTPARPQFRASTHPQGSLIPAGLVPAGLDSFRTNPPRGMPLVDLSEVSDADLVAELERRRLRRSGRPSCATSTRAPGARTFTAPARRPSRSTPGRARPGATTASRKRASRKRPSRPSLGRSMFGREMLDRNVFHRNSTPSGRRLHRNRAPSEPARSRHGSVRPSSTGYSIGTRPQRD